MNNARLWIISTLFSASFIAYGEADSRPLNVKYSEVVAQASTEPTKTISYGDSELEFGHLWLPSESPKNLEAKKPPLVIFIHGGCWLNQFDVKHSMPMTSALSEEGFAVWSIEYLRTGDEGGGWPGTFDSALRGVSAAWQLLSDDVDLTRVAITGHSAGGHLALLTEHALPASSSVAEVIGLAAITDLDAYARGTNSCEKATVPFMGGAPEALPEAYQKADPSKGNSTATPVLLHGTEDSLVPPFHATLIGDNALMIEGAGHFDWLHTDTFAYQSFVESLTEALK